MADGKYGRLFTERDVALIVGVAFTRGWRDGVRFKEGRPTVVPKGRDPLKDHVLQRVERNHALRFPADEPLFLLRGQDRAAWASVHYYAVYCDVLRADPGHCSAAHDAADALQEWQAQHPDRVKVPD